MRALRAFCMLFAIAACSGGTKPDAGADAWMRVDGAQFFRGTMPDDASGPAVAAVNLGTNTIRAGYFDKPFSGTLAPEATAAAIALGGDKGYWILPAGLADVQAPTFPTFKATLAFATTLPDGQYDLVVRAVGKDGRFGAPMIRPVSTVANATPDGKVVIALTWDTEADLDLHVVDPDGVEIFDKNVSSYEPPPPPALPDPNAAANAGILDFDSNAGCTIDGRRREDVVWKTQKPSGHYVARVDAPSLCGEISAHWTVEAFVDGQSVGKAQGALFESDTQFNHDRGAGILALEFDVP